MVNRLPRYQRYPARASVLMPNRLRVGGSGTGAWCPCINDRLVGEEGKLLRLAESAGVKRLEFLQQYMGSELEADWLERVAALLGRGWTRLVEKKDDVAQHRAVIAQIATEVKLPIAEFRRVV
jgi:RNA polymerase primary sigma factor